MADRWYEHPKLAPLHLEKTILPINEKIDAFLASFGYTHDRDQGLYHDAGTHTEKRIAVFAHECMGKIFMSHILDIPFPYYAEHFEMHTSALTVIRIGSTDLILRMSTYADFAKEVIPSGTLNINGVLTRFNNYWQFMISSTGDIEQVKE
jgi:hypothetical protein